MYTQNIIEKFNTQGEIITVRPFGRGHINDSYKLETIGKANPNYLLQRVNPKVFRNIKGLMNNIQMVTNHLIQKTKWTGLDSEKPLKLIPTKKGDYYLYEDHQYWRMYEFIDDTYPLKTIVTEDLIYEAGKGYGNFIYQLSDLPTKNLEITIPNFHSLSFRLENMMGSIKIAEKKRYEAGKESLSFIESNKAWFDPILRIRSKKLSPLRVVHNDTKLDNILFDKNGKFKCVVDLDTVMPGLIHYDFGDALRAGMTSSPEDEKDLEKISVDMDRFKAFSIGYFERFGDGITTIEKNSLSKSPAFMAFIMGVRFLTDFFQNDVYYKTSFEHHNLFRARCQFHLANLLMKREKEMRAYIFRLLPY